MKGEGGAIAVLHSENALLKCMVAGPWIVSLIGKFKEKSNLKGDKHLSAKHHEDNNVLT